MTSPKIGLPALGCRKRTEARLHNASPKITQWERLTKPEIVVRSALHKLGYRFRLHRKDLPGTPDIILPSRRLALFVHGCFWHGHEDPSCKLGRFPKSRPEFWVPKIEGNRARDRRKATALAEAGWRVATVWECELTNREVLPNLLQRVVEGH